MSSSTHPQQQRQRARQTRRGASIEHLRAILVAAIMLATPMVHAQTTQIVVSTAADRGAGSLRAALTTALADPEPHYTITFGDRSGPFSTPQTIRLSAPLPPIQGHVTINGFIDNLLWKSYGATISGDQQHSIFEVLPGANLHLTGITLADGMADNGAAIVNHGRLVVDGVSLFDNHARQQGGAILNFGSAWVINSTFSGNRASAGGAVAGADGSLHIIHATFHANAADSGASIWSEAELHVANSILAGPNVAQCINAGPLSPQTTHNLIEGDSEGCGTPMLTSNPHLQPRGYFNGPTQTMPISGASTALNFGLIEAAVDASGKPLRWDQRGNGDPRLAGGYPDLGAFEYQSRLPDEFVVDSLDDNGLRGCTIVGPPDCPLRAALELSAAARELTPIRFSPSVFDRATTLVLEEIPVDSSLPIVIDGQGVAAVTVVVPTRDLAWKAINGVTIELQSADGGD